MEWCQVHGFSCGGKHCGTGRCGRPTPPAAPSATTPSVPSTTMPSTGAGPPPFHPRPHFPRRTGFPGVYPYGYGYPSSASSVYVVPTVLAAEQTQIPGGPPEWYLTATKALGDAMLPVTSADTDSFWLDRLIEALRRWEADLKIRSDVARPPKRLT